MTKKYVLKGETAPAQAFAIDYAKELNASQLAVVTEAEGPCLVLAGAGSGKTRTLVYRVAYLLEKGVRPDQILLVTFTNKAAAEMRDRVELLLKTKAKGLWCGTFHHIGNRVLRMYGKTIGLSPDFGILDEEDSRDLVKVCLRSLELRSAGPSKFPKPSVVQSLISYAANAQKPLSEAVARRAPYLLEFLGQFEAVRRLYDQKKRRTQHLDYDDLLARWIELLDASEAARERLQRQFRYILVDEYQDTNRLQHQIVKRLGQHHRNILVVGDDAQSIYSFRAADIRNILDFPLDHPDCRIFKLETNYRSTRAILELANASIHHNRQQFPKTLSAVREKGELPQLAHTRDTRQEAAFVAQRLVELHETGTPMGEIAVLFRARYQAAELEMELAKRGVPYVIRGGVRFFEQAHIKDVLAYLKLLINPADEISWVRALTLYPGIGVGFAERVFNEFEKQKCGLDSVLTGPFGAQLPPKARESLASFKAVLKKLLPEDRRDRPDELIETVIESGYDRHVQMNFDNARDRLEDLKELVSFAHTYKSLRDFLADVTLRESFKGESIVEGASAADEPDEELVLSTIHQAKGLEWRTVFIIGLSEGQFPHSKSMDSADELEEERRLFYVASTRAKDRLILTHPVTRYDYNAGTVISRTSVFVQELPGQVYEEIEIEESQPEETIHLE